MIGYIYFLQKEDSVDVFKIVTVLGDIRQISIIIKAKVTNPEEKKQIFHDLLFNENYGFEVDFYRTTKEYIHKLIKLMDTREVKTIDCKIPQTNFKPSDMTELFEDGRMIKCKDEIGFYDKDLNVIIYEEKNYKSLSAFAKDIYGYTVNGWDVCQYESDDGWISVKKLKN